jgi:hypothetical protein
VKIRIASLFLSAAFATLASGAESNYDLVVYGGSSAGVAAAVQSARMGKSVIVIEQGDHLGGLTSGGLGQTDTGNKSVIGGVAREFYQEVKKFYDHPSAWKFERPEEYTRYRPKDDAMWTFGPRVAEDIFEKMLYLKNIPVVKRQRLNRESGVKMDGQHIVSIAMESGEVYRGKMFIDATYEGDLMAAAGVSYTVGRESNSAYDETLNGVQTRRNVKNHRFIVNVDPYVRPGDPGSGLLPGIHGEGPGEEGSADHRVQAYCFRMCMSNDPRNRVPFPKPEGYDELRYELLLRNLEAGDPNVPMAPSMMPNRKTDTNNNRAFSTDNIGMNYDYPEASHEERERIIAEHEVYQKGLMWTLANHPRVPKAIRDHMKQWGLAADEFLDNDNWPHQLYIREARRMVSDYVATEHDCRRSRIVKDPVGIGSYNMDSHNVQRYVTKDGFAQDEGDVQVSPGGPYLIGYRSIVPKRGEAENLFVPVCLSASHAAYGSIRMEPVFMILGQSAATAAAMAIDRGIAVQDVKYPNLKERLLADGQVLDLPPNSKPRIDLLAKSLPGIVIDDNAAIFTGSWSQSSSTQPYVEGGYHHDGAAGKGTKKLARFEAKLKPGRYEVRISYSAFSNRDSAVPVTVEYATGSKTALVNQKKRPAIRGAFHSLGEFPFAGDKPAVVIISNKGTTGHIIVDSVQFLPVK